MSLDTDVTILQLPEKSQKTNIEVIETYTVDSKPKKTNEKSPAEGERNQPKQDDKWEVTSSIVIGKGQKSGIRRPS